MRVELKEVFLHLVRLGIGTSKDTVIPNDLDWTAVKDLADRQGLSAVVLDGVDSIAPNAMNPLSVSLKLNWIGEVIHNYEQRYETYKKAIGSLAAFYNEHGYRMMVLKGYACSLDWPRPQHRPCGDIDIWMFGQWKKADVAVAKEKGIEIDNSHHHHTLFCWQGFSVENHYDFINIHHHKSNRELEKILKQEGEDDTHFVDVLGERVCLPSPNLHALFLLKHKISHFASVNIALRQILDWGFFVKAHGNEVDWNWLLSVLDRFGMKDMFNIFNAICVEDLGLDADIFPDMSHVDKTVKNQVLAEIISPRFSENMPEEIFRRVVWKFRRWHASSWKHRLCYNESMWSAFWSGVWNHLLKPRSI